MFRKLSLSISVALLIFVSASGALSARSASLLPDDSRFLPREQAVCGRVREKIYARANIRAIVKTSIQMGYNACLVVKCAIENGGDPRDAISGAIDAGATSDVVSRCAIDAGASVGEVLKDLRGAGSNVCYVEPLGYSDPTATQAGPPSSPPPAPQPISPFRP